MLEFGEKLEDIFSPIADGRNRRGLFPFQQLQASSAMSRSGSLDPLPDGSFRQSKRSDNKIGIIPPRGRSSRHVSHLTRFVIYLSCIRAVMDGYLPYSYEPASSSLANVVLD